MPDPTRPRRHGRRRVRSHRGHGRLLATVVTAVLVLGLGEDVTASAATDHRSIQVRVRTAISNLRGTTVVYRGASGRACCELFQLQNARASGSICWVIRPVPQAKSR